MNTEIANAVNAAGDKAQYDTRVKRVTGTEEYISTYSGEKQSMNLKGMKPEDVVKIHRRRTEY